MTDPNHLLDQIDRLEPELATAPWFVANANEDTEHMPFWQVVNDAYLNDPGTEDDVCCDVEMYVGFKSDAEFIALARTALPQLAKALRTVLELHEPIETGNTFDVGETHVTEPDYCQTCRVYSPCETYQAITGALGADHDRD